MCLFKKSFIPRIALKDIVVYKKVCKWYDGTLTTPVTLDAIEIGKTYKGRFCSQNTFNHPSLSPSFIKSLFSKGIDTGYIHSHICPKGAMWNTIIKCVIPRGTLYFIGEYGEIASRKLKYVEIYENK